MMFFYLAATRLCIGVRLSRIHQLFTGGRPVFDGLYVWSAAGACHGPSRESQNFVHTQSDGNVWLFVRHVQTGRRVLGHSRIDAEIVVDGYFVVFARQHSTGRQFVGLDFCVLLVVWCQTSQSRGHPAIGKQQLCHFDVEIRGQHFVDG